MTLSNMLTNSHFNDVLEQIEQLSVEDQQLIADILQQRLREARRDKLSQSILDAHHTHQSGEVFRGTVNEAIAFLEDE
jgi:hypothetical protein